MKLRVYKLWALLKKDFKMMLNNKNQLFMILLPVIFALLYQNIFSDMMIDAESSPSSEFGATFVLMLSSIVNLSALPISALSMMVAEEKEKNTMRTLMLCDVSATEFLISKILVVLASVELSACAIFVITKADMTYLLGFLFLTLIVALSILLLGAVVGLVAKDQMSTGTLSSPIMLLLMMPPMFAQMNSTIASVAKWLPTTSFMSITQSLLQNGILFSSDLIFDYAIIFLWIILGIFIFAFVYRKKGIDN